MDKVAQTSFSITGPFPPRKPSEKEVKKEKDLNQVLVSCFSKFDDLKDFIRVGGVCRRWRHAAKDVKLRNKVVQLNIKHGRRLDVELVYKPASSSETIIPVKHMVRNNTAYVLYANRDLVTWDIYSKNIVRVFPSVKSVVSVEANRVVFFDINNILHVEDMNSEIPSITFDIEAFNIKTIHTEHFAVFSSTLFILTPRGVFRLDKGAQHPTMLCASNLDEKTFNFKSSIRVMGNFLIIQEQAGDKFKVDIWDIKNNQWHVQDIECAYLLPLKDSERPTLIFHALDENKNYHALYSMDVESKKRKKIMGVVNKFREENYDQVSGLTISHTKTSELFEWKNAGEMHKDRSSRAYYNKLSFYDSDNNLVDSVDLLGFGNPLEFSKVEKYGPYILISGMNAGVCYEDNHEANAVWEPTTKWFDPTKYVRRKVTLSEFSPEATLSNARFANIILSERMVKIIDFSALPFVTFDPKNAKSSGCVIQ
jgi:hypothetical protein